MVQGKAIPAPSIEYLPHHSRVVNSEVERPLFLSQWNFGKHLATFLPIPLILENPQNGAFRVRRKCFTSPIQPNLVNSRILNNV
jgi:hypothetical protein